MKTKIIYILTALVAVGISYSLYTIQKPEVIPLGVEQQSFRGTPMAPPKLQSRIVEIRYAKEFNAEKDGSICNWLEGAEEDPPLVISRAQDLESCSTTHYSFKTADVETTLRSLVQAKQQTQPSEEGQYNDHSFEIDDWTYIYANLLNSEEVSELKLISKRRDLVGGMAAQVLKFRTID
jgi:hypothetical protein